MENTKDNVSITFNDERKALVVSGYAIELLKALSAKAGLLGLEITSTLRTPESQARAMYYNARNTGFDKQLALYGPIGRCVLYAALYTIAQAKAEDPNIPEEALTERVEKAMVAEINHQFPKRVSRHVVPPEEYARLNVLDIGYDSVLDKDAFRGVLAKAREEGLLDYIDEPENDCFHLEIPVNVE